MAQYAFGAGVLIGTQLTDSTGTAITNPSPVEFGRLQEVSLDISFENKTLYGSNQFPVEVGRGKGKVTGKAKAAQINGLLFNSMIFGQTLSSGISSDVYDTTGTAVPATPYTITPTPPSSGTWSRDLGVKDANNVPLTRVASAPATGQYSVAAGVYTFASADTTKVMFINFAYTATSTTAKKSTVQNVLMGYAPKFAADLYFPYSGKTLAIYLRSCISTKLMIASKLDDFMLPEFDFEGFADSSGNVFDWAVSE